MKHSGGSLLFIMSGKEESEVVLAYNGKIATEFTGNIPHVISTQKREVLKHWR